jgi:hypothetical protein
MSFQKKSVVGSVIGKAVQKYTAFQLWHPHVKICAHLTPAVTQTLRDAGGSRWRGDWTGSRAPGLGAASCEGAAKEKRSRFRRRMSISSDRPYVHRVVSQLSFFFRAAHRCML